MVQEITKAIVNAINNHQDKAVAAVTGIVGTMAGGLFGYLLERVRSYGRVNITLIDFNWSWQPFRAFDQQTFQPMGAGCNIAYSFRLRVLNTSPTPQSIALLAVEFFPAKKHRFAIGPNSRPKPLFVCKELLFGTEPKTRSDVALPGQTFTQVLVSGTGETVGEPFPISEKVHTGWKAIRLRFLVAPKKTIYFWHILTEAPTMPH